MAKMPEQLAQHTVDNYRCSKCFGLLVLTWAVDEEGRLEKTEEGEQLAEVKCRKENDDRGFVSQYFVDREMERDFSWAYEVKRDLIQMGIITKEKAYGN